MVGRLIEKEDIGDYKLIPATDTKVDDLLAKLNDAQRLGNEFKSKVSIAFNTEDGPLRVETTVWSLTERYIQIKSGILIPLISILSVEY